MEYSALNVFHCRKERMTTIRPIKNTDIQDVVSICANLWGHNSYKYVVVRQYFDLFPDIFFVASEPDDVISGFSLGGVTAHASEGWVLAVGVLRAFSGRGIGLQLSAATIDALFRSGVRVAKLTGLCFFL
jgi:ribosomal protein S18 acetylase RimI-like enzyme